ncbi:cell envelope integrity protein CreD [Sulfurimonas sp. HSL1-2]|uniref:cell envelope integrity protein CreD n=1 Tax=Thiomicrolovo zhangzhouensis TaxID=3131933 RepID=UPI0031F74D56
MEAKDTPPKPGINFSNSATLKIITIGVIILVLLIPLLMVSSVIDERETRRDAVVQEINQKWGSDQTITGPYFTVPYNTLVKGENGKTERVIRYIHLLPKRLKISGNIDSHIRYRSIYEAVLYNAQITLTGNFSLPDLEMLNINTKDILWENAILSVGITDMKGIQDVIDVTFDTKHYALDPGLKTTDLAASGVSRIIPLSPADTDNAFSLKLNLNGSEQLHFVPVGELTEINLKSGWPSPSFDGAFLPVSRKVTDDGFSAHWKLLHLNRNFPQVWLGNAYTLEDASSGVSLLITADVYQRATRMSKYALMFIVFTFAAFFFSDVLSKKRIHPIQYLLIGLAIVLFYVLLLSVSEQLNFDLAYILSAASITLMITAYSHGIVRNRFFTRIVFGILVVLYAYLYIVLQLEDYALLMGSLGLLGVLGTVMYITRNVDWYNLDDSEANVLGN